MANIVIFGDKMANLGPIDFKIGLYIKVNVNLGGKKFGQYGHQLSPNRPDATLVLEN